MVSFIVLFTLSSTYVQTDMEYDVLGQTYWYNNYETNYTVLPNDQSPGPMLGNDINVLLRQAYKGGNTLYADIDLRNIAYAKNVVLIFTTDNWQHSTSLNASYQSSTQTDYSSHISWPNAYNIERWRAVSTVPTTGPIQFYISYTVNGQTYYDNNYWSNYVLSN